VTTHIFYHHDMDGIATYFSWAHCLVQQDTFGLIVTSSVKERFFDMKLVLPEDSVVFLDLCPDPKTLEELFDKEISHITVIDHHEGAVPNIEAIESLFMGRCTVHFDPKAKGACLIPWAVAGKAVPDAIQLIGARDGWDFSDSRTAPLHEWLTKVGPQVEARAEWLPIFYDLCTRPHKLEEAISIGSQLVRHQGLRVLEHYRERCHRFMLKNGMEIPAVNTESDISEVGNALAASESLGVGVVWSMDPKGVRLSFRSEAGAHTTARECAESFGGSGRREAAGARISLGEFLPRLKGVL